MIEYANCTQANNCSSWIHGDQELSNWTEENGNFSLERLNDSDSMCHGGSNENDSGYGSDIFRFIILGIGISVVAILGL